MRVGSAEVVGAKRREFKRVTAKQRAVKALNPMVSYDHVFNNHSLHALGCHD